jgi:hypothetical protein
MLTKTVEPFSMSEPTGLEPASVISSVSVSTPVSPILISPGDEYVVPTASTELGDWETSSVPTVPLTVTLVESAGTSTTIPVRVMVSVADPPLVLTPL